MLFRFVSMTPAGFMFVCKAHQRITHINRLKESEFTDLFFKAIEPLAQSLVEALAAEFQPEKYKDAYRENLLQLTEAKKEGKEVVATPEPKQEKVVDILEALKASLAVAKKPAAIAQSITPIAEKAEPKRKRARG